MTEVTTTQLVPLTSYELLGGKAGVHHLVQRFYALMNELPEAFGVRRMHPQNLSDSAQGLFEFLSGWFAGPDLYVQKWGYPRPRVRQNPYVVGVAQRDKCMLCMAQALTEQVPEVAFRNHLITTFAQIADYVVNNHCHAAPEAASNPL